MLQVFHEQNVVNQVTKKDDFEIPLEIVSAIQDLTRLALDIRLQDGTHFITQLIEHKAEPVLTLSSMLGCKKHVINNIVRQVLIEHFNELAEQKDKEL